MDAGRPAIQVVGLPLFSIRPTGPLKTPGDNIMPASASLVRATQGGGSTALTDRLPPFARAANAVAHLAGRAGTFASCCLIVLIWAAAGPLFQYSDTWQLVINTGTTIVTFLMVFLIQNTQNREGAALQAKLDELIRATREARNRLVALEELPEEEVEKIREEVAEEAALCDANTDRVPVR
jgi:low affinity Fe/Cu permease